MNEWAMTPTCPGSRKGGPNLAASRQQLGAWILALMHPAWILPLYPHTCVYVATARLHSQQLGRHRTHEMMEAAGLRG
jgi:hypothetical protein